MASTRGSVWSYVGFLLFTLAANVALHCLLRPEPDRTRQMGEQMRQMSVEILELKARKDCDDF